MPKPDKSGKPKEKSAFQAKPSGRTQKIPAQTKAPAKPSGTTKRQSAPAAEITPDSIVWALMETADNCGDDEEALEIYTGALEVALENLPDKRPKGNLWSHQEWRTYLTARARYAAVLWTTGDRDLALDHFRDLVELNPQNNMGMTQVFASALFDLDQDDELEALLDQVADEPCATYLYTRALLLFRRDGAGDPADSALLAAMQYNYFVPLFLFSQLPLPDEPPSTIGEGDEREAISYVMDNADSWAKTEGAALWMAETIDTLAKEAKSSDAVEHKFADAWDRSQSLRTDGDQ